MADTKISDLPAVTTPAGTDVFAVAQGGSSKKITLSQVQAFAFSYASSYAPGSYTIATGTFRHAVRRQQFTTTQRLTIEGTGRLSLGN